MASDPKKVLPKKFGAECAGTTLITLFGCGVVALTQMQMRTNIDGGTAMHDNFATLLVIAMGWAGAVTFGILISYDETGAHLNPAVTLQDMIYGQMDLTTGLMYFGAQFLGAMLGSFFVTLNFVVFKGGDVLDNFYSTGPPPGVSHTNAFFQEVFGTCMLMILILAVVQSNPDITKFHVGGFVGFGIFVLIATGIGNCMNPARDLGPRIVHAMFQLWYGKANVWDTFCNNRYWLIPVIGPFIGAPLGTYIYKRCVEQVDVDKDSQFKLGSKRTMIFGGGSAVSSAALWAVGAFEYQNTFEVKSAGNDIVSQVPIPSELEAVKLTRGHEFMLVISLVFVVGFLSKFVGKLGKRKTNPTLTEAFAMQNQA